MVQKRKKEEAEKIKLHTEPHSNKTVKATDMEVVWQVLGESVSGNWERGDRH